MGESCTARLWNILLISQAHHHFGLHPHHVTRRTYTQGAAGLARTQSTPSKFSKKTKTPSHDSSVTSEVGPLWWRRTSLKVNSGPFLSLQTKLPDVAQDSFRVVAPDHNQALPVARHHGHCNVDGAHARGELETRTLLQDICGAEMGIPKENGVRGVVRAWVTCSPGEWWKSKS